MKSIAALVVAGLVVSVVPAQRYVAAQPKVEVNGATAGNSQPSSVVKKAVEDKGRTANGTFPAITGTFPAITGFQE